MKNDELIHNIRRLCKENGISVSQLERDLYLSPGLISRWAKNTPTLERIIDIANYFNVSIDTIVSHEPNLGSNNQLNQRLLVYLYNKSLSADIDWNVFGSQILASELYSLSEKDSNQLLENDCYYTNIENGYFFLTIHYNSDDQLQLSLYALADKHSELYLITTDSNKLMNIYKYLTNRLNQKLIEQKTHKYIESILTTDDQEENSQNTEKITTIDNNISIVYS